MEDNNSNVAGFAVMALGAVASNPALDIKIVPVGIYF